MKKLIILLFALLLASSEYVTIYDHQTGEFKSYFVTRHGKNETVYNPDTEEIYVIRRDKGYTEFDKDEGYGDKDYYDFSPRNRNHRRRY